MVKINEFAVERWEKQMAATKAAGDDSLQKCYEQLQRYDGTVEIFEDYDPLSFTFKHTYPNGQEGIFGGIIYHGRRDNYGSGGAPTFSVCLKPTTGYSIHT